MFYMTIMRKGIQREYIIGVAPLLALLAIAQFATIPAAYSSGLTGDDVIVLNTTYNTIQSENDYTFQNGTALEFKATTLHGWQFDYIYVNFGCEVGGVTGANVTEIYSVEDGYIESCELG